LQQGEFVSDWATSGLGRGPDQTLVRRLRPAQHPPGHVQAEDV